MPGVVRMNGSSANDMANLRPKAAYLMVKGSIGEDLLNIEEFIEALQYAGEHDGIMTC